MKNLFDISVKKVSQESVSKRSL